MFFDCGADIAGEGEDRDGRGFAITYSSKFLRRVACGLGCGTKDCLRIYVRYRNNLILALTTRVYIHKFIAPADIAGLRVDHLVVGYIEATDNLNRQCHGCAGYSNTTETECLS